MKVSEKLISTITELQGRGDIARIVSESGMSHYEITKVFNGDDKSHPEAVASVTKFYQERKETISDYLTD